MNIQLYPGFYRFQLHGYCLYVNTTQGREPYYTYVTQLKCESINVRELKHDVKSRRQTAKKKIEECLLYYSLQIEIFQSTVQLKTDGKSFIFPVCLMT